MEQIFKLLQEMRSEQSERFDRLESRMDKFEGRMDKLEGRMDNFEGRMDKLEGRMDNFEADMGQLHDKVDQLDHELKEFRQETSQNFAMVVNETRKVRGEMNDLQEQHQSDFGHLELKTDAVQSELLRLKRQ